MIKAIYLPFALFFLTIFNIENSFSQVEWQSSGGIIPAGIEDVEFVSPTQAWAVGGNGVIFTTQDGWITFCEQQSGTENHLSSVDFYSETLGWAVGSNGVILVTNDGGLNWTTQFSNNTVFLNSVKFISSTTGFAVGDNGIILSTTDGGTSWSSEGLGTLGALKSIYFINSIEGWIIGTNGGLWKTIDGGINWIAQNTGTTIDFYSIFFISPLQGWIAGNYGVVFTTSNGGVTWSPQTSGVNSALMSVNFISPTHGWAVGYQNTLITTNNGGVTWTNQSIGVDVNYLNDTYFISSTEGWIVGAAGTILKTTDGGNNWSVQNMSIGSLNNVFSITDSITWAVGDGGKILKTDNAGLTWGNQNSGVSQSLNVVRFVTPTTGCVSGQNGLLLRTNNAGETWNIQNTGTTNHLNGLSFVSSLVGWAVGDDGTILKTEDGGISWNSQVSGTNFRLMSVSFFDENIGCIVGANGTILTTNNGGLLWEISTTGVYPELTSVQLISANIGYAVGSSSTIIKTTDGGATWLGQGVGGSPEWLYSVCFTSTEKGWVAGPGGIISTNDGGLNWIPQLTSINASFQSIHFSSENCGYAAGILGIRKYRCVTPSPIATDQTLCSGSNIADLYISGLANALFRWYDAPNGGALMDDTTSLTNGIYYATQEFEGCESTIPIQINVLINSPSSSTFSYTACTSYTWNGNTFTSSGTYVDTLTNVNGCDSIVNLELTINSPTSSSISHTECTSYLWTVNGQSYSISGIYTGTLMNSIGCDSIITLNLTIIDQLPLSINTYSIPSDVNNCNGVLVIQSNGNEEFTSNIDGGIPFTHTTYETAQGLCEGIHTLTTLDACNISQSNIFVIPSDTNYVFNNPFIDSIALDSLGTTIENCDIYYNSIDTAFIDSIFAIANEITVIWTIVDSSGVNFDTSTYLFNNGNGVYYLQLSVFCSNKSIGEYFTVGESIYFGDGVFSTAANALLKEEELYSIFPNPSTSIVTVKTSLNDAWLQILDAQGRVIFLDSINDHLKIVSLDSFETGVYFFCLKSNSNYQVKKVLKQ